MNERGIIYTAVTGLALGFIFGIAGSMVPDDVFRNLAWAVDSAGLIVAAALLTLYYFRKGNDMLAAGFLVFAIAQSMVFSSCATNLFNNISSFGAGSFMWAVSLVLISSQNIFPLFVRFTGIVTAGLFAIVAVQILTGIPLNPLAKPLPFFAYPFYAATIGGWIWTLLKSWSRAQG